ncbi:MAG: stage II sporulation protein P [Clostridia bacterium]|nr:stage II sporulation protein P [Clostridia bacterium]
MRLRGLCAAVLLVLLCMPGAARAQKTPLRIECIMPEATQAAAMTQERPRVLIYHTHTWEAYRMTDEAQYIPTETWRTKDAAHNMIRVGEKLAQELETRGFVVVHDKTAFEPPTLSDAYSRSLQMIESRLSQGESYDYILDVHRDAYSGPYNGANGVEHEGTPMAYVMLLVGKGTGATGAGFDERPDWPQNLELAEQITEAMSGRVRGIARDVKVKSGRFNQHVSTGALLIEVGNNHNTLEEALASCAVIADAIADVHAARNAE